MQGAVQQRIAQLTPAAKHALYLAAGAARRFDFTLLQELSQHAEQELLRLIKKELIAAQLIIGESAEKFAFRHALTQEAIYADMLARERKTLHRMIAESIERRYADTPEIRVADLAYHFFHAEVWTKLDLGKLWASRDYANAGEYFKEGRDQRKADYNCEYSSGLV